MEKLVELSHKEFLKLDRDFSKAAKVADLVYVSDKDPGIARVKNGSGLAYIYDNKPLKKKRRARTDSQTGYPAGMDKRLDLCERKRSHSGNWF